ncbi:MAG: pyrimidine dimer DNA glycosylase/endonuclease V [bacterium]
MRLWSIHPKYLDSIGLVALWREALLAQKVLQGKTKGYKYHPQLDRFKRHPYPIKAIATYLEKIWDESLRRGYSFNRAKIGPGRTRIKIRVTKKELKAEFEWLLTKLRQRDKEHYLRLKKAKRIYSMF